jgi:N-acetylmuramoyl-L-alanine amidase
VTPPLKLVAPLPRSDEEPASPSRRPDFRVIATPPRRRIDWRLAVFYWLCGGAGILLALLVLAQGARAQSVRLPGAGGRLETVETRRFTESDRGIRPGEYVSERDLARILRGTWRYDGAARTLAITAEQKTATFMPGADRFVIAKPSMTQVAGRLPRSPVRRQGVTWFERSAAQAFLKQFHAAAFRPLGAAIAAVIPNPFKPDSVPARPMGPGESTAWPAPVAAAPRPTAPPPPAVSTGRVAPFIRNIVIDAGHGAHDAGAVGPGGTREKDVNLDVALKLERALASRVAGRLHQTRRDDTFLELRQRVDVAKRQKADLFISIHANSSGSRNRHLASGVEVYFFSSPSDEDARLAERIEGGPFDPRAEGIDPVLWDLMLAGNVVESHKLAEAVIARLPRAAGLPNRGVKSARFYVMYYGVISNFPSILIELGFLSNPDEEKKLADPEWRTTAAEAIADAVTDYLRDLERRYPGGRGWIR